MPFAKKLNDMEELLTENRIFKARVYQIGKVSFDIAKDMRFLE